MRRYLFLALTLAAVLAATIGAGHLQEMTSSDRDALAQRSGLLTTDIGLVTTETTTTSDPGGSTDDTVCGAGELEPPGTTIPGATNSDLNGVQSPGDSGSYQMVAFQPRPRPRPRPRPQPWPGNRTSFTLDVRVVGQTPPANPTATAFIVPPLPNDRLGTPTASAEIIETGAGKVWRVEVPCGRSVSGCVNPVQSPNAVLEPRQVQRDGLIINELGGTGEGNTVIRVSGSFRYVAGEEFTLRLTCYRP